MAGISPREHPSAKLAEACKIPAPARFVVSRMLNVEMAAEVCGIARPVRLSRPGTHAYAPASSGEAGLCPLHWDVTADHLLEDPREISFWLPAKQVPRPGGITHQSVYVRWPAKAFIRRDVRVPVVNTYSAKCYIEDLADGPGLPRSHHVVAWAVLLGHPPHGVQISRPCSQNPLTCRCFRSSGCSGGLGICEPPHWRFCAPQALALNAARVVEQDPIWRCGSHRTPGSRASYSTRRPLPYCRGSPAGKPSSPSQAPLGLHRTISDVDAW